MKKYHFNIRINNQLNNAGSKATRDCQKILIDMGFEDRELNFIKSIPRLPYNVFKLVTSLASIYFTVESGSFFVVQYPLQGINSLFPLFTRLLRKKGCRFCAIVHDLDSLRSPFDRQKIEAEIKNLSGFDALISHNNSMTSWLRTNGYKGFITEIELFDYLVPENCRKEQVIDENVRVTFAGNLGRGNFLKELYKREDSYQLKLYGSGLSDTNVLSIGRLEWLGSFSPEEIVDEIDGDFGLIWDGESISELSGLMGKYLEINTPHKTSLYLTAGIPVIAPKASAISRFIDDHNLGISVDTVADIADSAAKIDRDTYEKMLNNAYEMGSKLKDGYFLRQALNKVERALFGGEHK